MMLRVYVDSPEEFSTWLNNQKKPAVEDSRVRAERDYFLSQACVNCHVVRGTAARGTFGPDLTHLGSRRTLAALTIPNTPRDLYTWITNPQSVKPGAEMPWFASLPAAERRALVVYLEGLR